MMARQMNPSSAVGWRPVWSSRKCSQKVKNPSTSPREGCAQLDSLSTDLQHQFQVLTTAPAQLVHQILSAGDSPLIGSLLVEATEGRGGAVEQCSRPSAGPLPLSTIGAGSQGRDWRAGLGRSQEQAVDDDSRASDKTSRWRGRPYRAPIAVHERCTSSSHHEATSGGRPLPEGSDRQIPFTIDDLAVQISYLGLDYSQMMAKILQIVDDRSSDHFG